MCAGMWVDRPWSLRPAPLLLLGTSAYPGAGLGITCGNTECSSGRCCVLGVVWGVPDTPTSLCWTQGFTSSTEGTEGVAPRPRPSQEITALSTRDHFNSLLNPLGCRQWNFPGPQGYLPTTCPACCRTGCQQPFPSERGDVTRPQSCYDQFSSRPQAWLFLLALPR